MDILDLKPSARVGEILEQVRLMQAEGKVSNKSEAVEAVRAIGS